MVNVIQRPEERKGLNLLHHSLLMALLTFTLMGVAEVMANKEQGLV